jgi:predicted alpha/beta-hydrolase family hydrolase
MPGSSMLVLGSSENDMFMEALVSRIETAGIRVLTVSLDASVTEDAIHRGRFRDAMADVATSPIIGGFSIGARIAATMFPDMFPDVRPRACLGFGYPFHAARDSQMQHGLQAIRRVNVPTRIIQGTRDPHGNEAEVKSYRLPDSVQMSWLPDGNHRYVPRQRSGFTREDHLETAAEFAVAFIRSQ